MSDFKNNKEGKITELKVGIYWDNVLQWLTSRVVKHIKTEIGTAKAICRREDPSERDANCNAGVRYAKECHLHP